jgi:translation initiation factor 2 subunit 2
VADPEVDLFAGMKKKKKKQVTLDVEDQEQAPAPVEAASQPTVVEEARAAPAAEENGVSGTATPVEADKPAEDGGDLFADLKKKKKKKKDIPADLVSVRESPFHMEVGHRMKEDGHGFVQYGRAGLCALPMSTLQERAKDASMDACLGTSNSRASQQHQTAWTSRSRRRSRRSRRRTSPKSWTTWTRRTTMTTTPAETSRVIWEMTCLRSLRHRERSTAGRTRGCWRDERRRIRR